MSNQFEKFLEPAAIGTLMGLAGGGVGYLLNWYLNYKKQESESKNSSFSQQTEYQKYRDSRLEKLQQELETAAASNRAFLENKCKEQANEIQDLESRLEKMGRENSEILGKMAAIELQNLQIEERRNSAFDRLRRENEDLRKQNQRLASANIKLQQRIGQTGTTREPPPKSQL